MFRKHHCLFLLKEGWSAAAFRKMRNHLFTYILLATCFGILLLFRADFRVIMSCACFIEEAKESLKEDIGKDS